MSDFPQCVDCARRGIQTIGGRCWSCDRNAARAQGVAEERARVVAWLRERLMAGLWPSTRMSFAKLLERIERGEHEEGT